RARASPDGLSHDVGRGAGLLADLRELDRVRVLALLHQRLGEEGGESGPSPALAHLLERVVTPTQLARGGSRIPGQQLDRAGCVRMRPSAHVAQAELFVDRPTLFCKCA